MDLDITIMDTAVEREFAERLAENIVNHHARFSDFSVSETTPLLLPFETMQGEEILNILKLMGGARLGLTYCELVYEMPPCFGLSQSIGNSSVVSLHDLYTTFGANEEKRLSRTVKVAMHELGHNFGLKHHYSEVRNERGDLCPMTHLQKSDREDYVRGVIDRRGYEYCPDCERFLRYTRARKRL